MKIRQILAGLFLAGTVASTAGDMRYLGNSVFVDLQPLHDWLVTHEGERPLPAWKSVHVLELGEAVSIYRKCKIQMDGKTGTVLLDNIPAEMLRILSEKARLALEIPRLQNYLKAEERRIRDLTDMSVNWDYGSEAWNNLVRDRTALKRSRDELADKQESYRELMTTVTADTTDFIMFTSKKYSGYEIWNFGAKR